MNVRSQTIYWTTLAAWIVGLLVHAILYVCDVLSLPRTEEAYAFSVPFQLIAFAYSRGGFWLAGLLLVLFLEIAAFGRKK